MVFPILGDGGIGSPFGAPRDGGRRLHEGNDLFAAHLTPIVAVADGTITRIAPDQGISGYYVVVSHADGWSSLYIHLNNDTVGSDDGMGIGIRPDLSEGDEVVAGEVIGWNGDSGNAEGTVHHLHFELHDPTGTPVDPEASLEAAERYSPSLPDGVPSFNGAFADHQWLDPDGEPRADLSPLAVLLSRGVPVWCDESGAMACPDQALTAEAGSSWLAAILTGETVELPEDDEAQKDEVEPVDESDEGRASLIHPICLDPQGCPSAAPLGAHAEAAADLAAFLCADLEGCPEDGEEDRAGITEADIARIFAWDILTDYFRSQSGFVVDEEVPDSSWTTPLPAPPDTPSELTLGETYWTLDLAGRCLALPDTTTGLSRSEAADWIVRYLSSSSRSHCLADDAAPTS